MIDPRFPGWKLIYGDAAKAHAEIEPGSVSMAATSPPGMVAPGREHLGQAQPPARGAG
jgi:hypothetical protein